MSMSGCSRKRKFSETYFELFDSYAELTAYADSKDAFEEYDTVFFTQAKLYHKLLDPYDEYDGIINVCTLNRIAPNTPIEISQELFDFLAYAKELHSLTCGFTSVTFGAVTSVWKDAIYNRILPETEILEVAAKHVDIRSLVLDEEKLTVYYQDSLLRLDTGALAKGYVADILADSLIQLGCESFLINLGGTLYAHGSKPNGERWQGGISAPEGYGSTAIAVDISEKALSTSGSYYRGFELDGITYHHIIDPVTLFPKNDFVSVSVLGRTGAQADALSTALFSMSFADGYDLIVSLDGTDAVWIFSDGTTQSTDGIDT